ncbi:LysR family transcriptional regulator [Sphingorhabdus sp.]|uniref:LysR family transcriptional regulator n=1 Tax=Sphingorhabdus sp. TaxID=1902408 RepID=UPI00333F40AA
MNHLNNFSGKLLSAFLALVDTGQFKIAAERCNVSQSAFSQMISRLEEQIGTKLFDRDTRHVSLTQEGRLLVPIARTVASDIQAMYDELHDYAEKRIGKVSIAALPSLSADWLPKIVADFRRLYPGIKLQLHDTVAEPNLELIRKGVVDFAINAVPYGSEEFDTEFLFDEPYYFICRADHEFAIRKSISLKELKGCRYIHTLRTGSLWRWIEPHVQNIEFNDTGFEVQQLSTLAGLIANGMGESLVPGFGLFQFHRLGLKAVLVNDRELLRPLFMVKRRGQTLSVAARSLLAMIAANPPQHVLPALKSKKS